MIIVACVLLLLFVWFGPRCRADGQPDEISAEREGGWRPDRAIGIGTARAHAQEILNSTSLTPSTGVLEYANVIPLYYLLCIV